MELLYVVGGLILLALLWRGISWLREFQRRVRVRLEPVPPGPETIDSFPELGKVRVRPRFSDDMPPDEDVPLEPVIVVGTRDRADRSVIASSPERTDQPRTESAGFDAAAAATRTEPSMALSAARELPGDRQPSSAPTVAGQHLRSYPAHAPSSMQEQVSGSVEGEVVPPPVENVSAAPEQPPVLLTPVASPIHEAEQQDMFADQTIAPPPMPGRTRTRAQALYDSPPVEPVRSVRQADARPHVDVQDVIALHVVSRQHPFNGEDLLRCILSYGLRFGDMNIFHRHERPTGQGQVLFSMAKAVEPGTFDLQEMTGEEIPGVSFFLSLPGVSSILAYDIMVDTAKRLATELQGDILDEQSQPLTRQLIEHYRERVQEFERRRLMQRPSH
ncbi:MAG TPA: cell division protein ZipA [Moraxellaceae bacterium]|nr:cell division protein ZipA [Moraxellaceae bacterium]